MSSTPDSVILEMPGHVGQSTHPVADSTTHPPVVVVDLRLPEADDGDRLGRCRKVRFVENHDFDGVATDGVLEVRRRVVRDGPAGVDEGNAVGETIRLFEVLRREQHGGALGDQAAHGVPHLVAAARIQPRRRFVEKEHLGREDQAGGQVEASPHPAAVLLHALVAGVGEIELGEQVDGTLLGTLGAEVEEPPEHLQVLSTGEDLIHGGVLTGEANPSPHLHRVADDVETGDGGTTSVGLDQCRQDAYGGRLAGTVRAEYPVHGLVRDSEIEPVECLRFAVALLESLGEHGVVIDAQHVSLR